MARLKITFSDFVSILFHFLIKLRNVGKIIYSLLLPVFFNNIQQLFYFLMFFVGSVSNVFFSHARPALQHKELHNITKY